jgi:hypothetical protein
MLLSNLVIFHNDEEVDMAVREWLELKESCLSSN